LLSYQHAYHAGNAADVQKHAALAWVVDYLTQKDKPLTYIETHAGRGLYDLSGPEATKTGEAAQGVDRLAAKLGDHPYIRALAATRAQRGPDAYPGSPMIAAMGLRDTDTMHLCEMHPQEHAALDYAMAPWGPTIRREDGLAYALSITPPTPRRGLMLVDPSYEVKSDYDTVPKTLIAVARRWNVGILMLWYPVLTDVPHAPMLRTLTQAFPGALRHEVRFPPARAGHRMTGSGLFVVNPPYGLADELARLGRLFS
jgi:23S rRNA (adenine2030-N6)-methyltransferase